MRYFEDLDWRPAFKRAAFFVALWLVTIYALSVAFPESFNLGLDSSGGVAALLVNAFFFFLLFSMVTAFTERSRRRARGAAGQGTQKSEKPPKTATGSGAEDGEAGNLKGRHNPNTSRKKASRRRRR